MTKKRINFKSVAENERFSGSVITVLVIAVFVLINVVLYILVNSLGLFLYSKEKDDLTLSGSTDALFASAIESGKTVKISFCNTEDNVKDHSTGRFVYETVNYFKERYPDFIEIDYINIITRRNADGEFVDLTKYKTDMKGNEIPIYKTSVIFESGKNHKVLTDTYSTAGYANFFTLDSSGNATSYNGESVTASMISWVLNDEHKTAYFTMRHGEVVDVAFSDLLTSAGYYIDVLDLRKNEVPSDAALVIISNPAGDFEKASEGSGIRSEIERLETYLERGGNLFVTLDPYVKTLPVLENYLKSLGFVFSTSETEDGRIVRNLIKDSSNAITTDGFTLVAEYSDGELQKKIRDRVSEFSDGDVIIREVSALELSLGAKPILISSSSSVCEADGKTVATGGGYTVAAYNEFETENGKGTVFVIPSIYLAVSDSLITNGYSNKDFLFSLFENVYGAEDLPYGCRSILYDTTTLENLTMGAAKTYLFFIMLIPVGVAITGAVVLIKRKNR